MTATTIELTDEEAKDLQELTQAQNVAGAIHSALTEYRRYARRMRLKEMPGKVEFIDNWRSLEAAELDESRPR